MARTNIKGIKGSKRRAKFQLDPAHNKIDIFAQPITQDIWNDKYRWHENPNPEDHPFDSMQRVVSGVYKLDDNVEAQADALEAMQKALWVPGGRIHAGAGTPKIVTLINCYVDRTIEDSMDGIADALKDAMLTMQQGGGIGMDFSTLRPNGARLNRTGAVASGPLPFMEMWDSMCATIMSAGSRQGAMMGTMHCEHPDLPAFIKAKETKGRLTNFNVSVLVTDAFMEAVENDEDWYLGFTEPRADGKHHFVTQREDLDDKDWYAYEHWKARDLWDLIIRHTYEFSEPGVIFIDRINDTNNLQYVETISCTNPCGEQPLPPNGACNLGAVNLARMVKKPFTPKARFDFNLMRKIVKVGVRFLDNVIDVTNYPLDEQREEEENKRRIGLGFMGLGDVFAMMCTEYGSDISEELTDKIGRTLMEAAYEASAELAEERGAFPMFNAELWGDTPVVKSLPKALRDRIFQGSGIRNGVLLTMAPTGTTAIYMGNPSSGLEPIFLLESDRKVRQPDDTYRSYTACDYAWLLANEMSISLSKHWFSLAMDLPVDAHLTIQSIMQKYIDASISKTINIPEDMPFREFEKVYMTAYLTGCKGCTTYRPNDIRGSVLSKPGSKASPLHPPLPTRPMAIRGTTYKLKWPGAQNEASYYVTINDHNGKPFEIFIQSTSSKYTDWSTSLSLMISAVMRRGDDISFVPEELSKVVSVNDYGWVNNKLYGSLVALIGETIGNHLEMLNGSSVDPELNLKAHEHDLDDTDAHTNNPVMGDICKQCSQPTVIHAEGCKLCTNCGFSTCG